MSNDEPIPPDEEASAKEQLCEAVKRPDDGQGTTSALLALIKSEEHKLLDAAYSITRQLHAAEDALSDLRVRILEADGSHRFANDNHMRAHLYKALRNLAIDYVRAEKRRSGRREAIRSNELNAKKRRSAAREQAAVEARLHRAMKALLPLLPPRRREVASMRFKGASPKEIAEKMGIKISTVKKQIVLAGRDLRRLQAKRKRV